MSNINYFYRLLTGKIELKIVFWFWFIFFTLIIEFLLQELFIQNKLNEKNYSEFILYFLILIYSIFISLSIFKTAKNYNGKKIYSFLAKVFVSINLFFSANIFLETTKFYFFEDYAIENEINHFRKDLPIQIDMNSTLIDIYKEEKIINYKYQLFEVSLENEILKNKFKKQIQDSLCEDETTLSLLKKDYVLKYNYINEKEEILINITTDKQNCGDSIYDLEILNQIAKKQGII